jgi:RNA polymerase sigma-70 factor (ECF subfamily)
VGEWLPEPLPDPAAQPGLPASADPADRVTLDESVTMAFLVVLETMTPAERVAFVLHDVFRYPFTEVAEIVGRTPAACRQLASSARGRVRAGQAPAPAAAKRSDVVRDFRTAWEAKDIPALISLLDPDATATADGGGKVSAALRPVQGGEQVARYLAGLAGRIPDLTIAEAVVNGQPGLIGQQHGVTVTVFAFGVTAEKITRIWIIRNPDKLTRWTNQEGDLESLQVVGDLERGAGGLAELVDVAVGGQGGQDEAVVGHVEHGQVGDDLVDDAAAGQRQRALGHDLG